MFHSQISRKLWLAVATAGLIAVTGCSGQQDQQASNQAPNKANKPAKAAPKPAAAAKAVAAKPGEPKVVPVSAKAAQPTGHVIIVPKGTQITATVDQTLKSDKNHQGDTFAASLAAPIKVDGKTVLPKGAHITGKVATIKKHELKVQLASVVVHGKNYDLETNSLRPSDKIQAKTSKDAANKSADKNADKQKKDNSTLSAKSQLTFKLSKPVSVAVKG
jgi:hypothetical protein